MEYYSAIKRRVSSNRCCNMDEPRRQYAKWNKPGPGGRKEWVVIT